MKRTAKALFALLSFALLNSSIHASELKLESDLMIHPHEISNFFTLAAQEIEARPSWTWPSLSFTRPYRTSWSQVEAHGPFQVRFGTQNLTQQEVEFELTWAEPVVTVGRFEIHDTVERTVGGVHVIIALDGACNNMTMHVPQGAWTVRGRLRWDWSQGSVSVQWQDFQFAQGGTTPAEVDLGQCEGPAGLHEALKDAITSISQDRQWLEDVLRDGTLDWVQQALGQLQTQLLLPREMPVKNGLSLVWEPSGLSGLSSGLIRVAGHVNMRKDDQQPSVKTVARGYSDETLSQVSESGFIMPKGTLQELIDFVYSVKDLKYRVGSDKIESFNRLMGSRFLQFWVWPDLMNFAKETLFYFDFTTAQSPSIKNGVMKGNGVVYDIQAPLSVNQWAPYQNQYLRYVDFRTQMNGQFEAQVADGNLTLQIRPNDLSVVSGFRPEYMAVRQVNRYIADSTLGSRMKDYLSANQFTLPLPTWSLGSGVNLTIKGVQAWKHSFRVPLDFKNSK